MSRKGFREVAWGCCPWEDLRAFFNEKVLAR